MGSCKGDSNEIGTPLLIELEEAKKKLNVIRGIIDDVLEAAEEGIKKLSNGEKNGK